MIIQIKQPIPTPICSGVSKSLKSKVKKRPMMEAITNPTIAHFV